MAREAKVRWLLTGDPDWPVWRGDHGNFVFKVEQNGPGFKAYYNDFKNKQTVWVGKQFNTPADAIVECEKIVLAQGEDDTSDQKNKMFYS